jgi:hypothetical protein
MRFEMSHENYEMKGIERVRHGRMLIKKSEWEEGVRGSGSGGQREAGFGGNRK